MIDKAKILKTEILSDNWYTLKKITYEYFKSDGARETQAEKLLTEVMVLLFYFIIKNKKL